MEKEQSAIVDRRGNAIGTIAVTVLDHGTANPSTIYSDNGSPPTPQANPFNCDSLGRWSFYAANGRYDIEFSGSTIITYKMEDVLVSDSEEANAVEIQGHAVDETDLGNDKVLVYKSATETFVYEEKGTPAVHAESHEDGGGDEISVAGLAGLLVTPQTPAAHKTSHQNAGSDEISVEGLSGLLADAQTALAHKTSHENAGGDEISVEGLSGLLADSQTPLAHKTSHENAGGDEISVAGLSGVLADKQDADKIQGHVVTETAIGNNKILVYKVTGDQFVYEDKGVPAAHATSHQDGGGDEISVANLSGVLADKQDADKIQGHTVDEAALGDAKILVYKTATGTFVYEAKGTPAAHAASHQDGGGDEISVEGLSGLLADSQTPLAHKTSHENAGGDEISVAGLSGVLADKQDADKIQGHTVDETAIADDTILVYKTSGDKFIYEEKGTPSAHAASHQNGGGDEISVADLSGVLADEQNAGAIKGHAVDETDIGDDKVLVYKTDGTKFVYEEKGGASVQYATIVFPVPGDAIVAGNVCLSVIIPYTSCTILKAYAYSRTAPTGAALIFDINKNGTTIWTTQGNRLQVAAGANSGTQTNFDVTALAEGDRLDLDVDQIGSTVPGADITVELKVQL